MDIDITEKQEAFINSTAFETLFGGAARRRQKFCTTDRCLTLCFEIREVETNYIQKNIC